ncbi:MAG: hypothetical protein ACLP0B_14455 [Steroidobacteraceae bacterium]|jgi:hypothetical protein
MTKLLITVALTACFWVYALLLAVFMPFWGDWRWMIAIWSYAVPMTAYGWAVFAIAHFVRPTLSVFRLALISGSLPTIWVIITAAAASDHWRAGERSVRYAEHLSYTRQLNAAALESFDDEPLVDNTGPIGVRLHYSVSYPRGLNPDPPDSLGPRSKLSALQWGSSAAFLMLRRTMTPPASGALSPGTYAFTEDYIPAFMPSSYLSPSESPTSAKTFWHCFRWQPGVSRSQILTQDAETFAVEIYVSAEPIRRSTNRNYKPSGFYATAVAEGALECPH